MNARLREQYEIQYHEETGKNPYALMTHCGAHTAEFVDWFASRLALAERKAEALDKLEEMSIVYDHVDINGGLTDIEPFRQSKIRLCLYDASLEKTLSTFAPTLLEAIEDKP